MKAVLSFRDHYGYGRSLSGGTFNLQTAVHHFPDAIPGILYAQMPFVIVNRLPTVKTNAIVGN